MCNRYEYIQGAHAIRRQGAVGDAGVLDVEGRICGEDVCLFDVAEVLLIVLGEIDGVVLDVIVTAFDAEVEHEGRAGILLALDIAIGPAAADA